MNFYANHDRSGEEIRAGDLISWAGQPARVACVLGSPDCPSCWASMQAWLGEEFGDGVLLDTELAGLVFERESDEDMKFLGRNP